MQKKLKIVLIGLWTVMGLTVGGVAGGVWLYRSTQHTPPASAINYNSDDKEKHRLEPLFDSPAFTLTDQNGNKFDSTQLRGKVWVADFVFTQCSGLCPLMTSAMHEFQQKSGDTSAQMVSFSVDPENDTPSVLKDYARSNQADLSRWHFLTGDKEALWKISNEMKLAIDKGDSSHQIMHSSHFLLVDGNGHVRGIYDYKEPGYMGNLLKDTRALLAEK